MLKENKLITKVCSHCGKKFEIQEYKLYIYENHIHYVKNNRKYCCKECRYKATKINGEKTSLERYGIRNITAFGTEKHKEAIRKKYGVDNVFQAEKIKAKIKQTNLKKYGVEYPLQSKEIQKKSKQTCMEKYGVEYTGAVKEIKEKVYATNLKKYGAKTVVQSKEWQLKNGKALQEKRYITMKKNNTFNTSKSEIEIYNLLKNKFINVQREYKSEKYPFKCDFYIPEINTWIEYQGHQSHGVEPYDPNNSKHLQIVAEWFNKGIIDLQNGKQKSVYFGYIDVWTKRDPLKRQIAKDNNLNWIEFFNIKEFMEWYKTVEI